MDLVISYERQAAIELIAALETVRSKVLSATNQYLSETPELSIEFKNRILNLLAIADRDLEVAITQIDEQSSFREHFLSEEKSPKMG